MLFGMKFLVTIGMIQATLKALVFKTPVFESPSDCLVVVCLQGRIV